MHRQPRLALALTAIVLAACSPDAPAPTPAPTSSAPSTAAAPQPTETPTPSPSSEPSPSPSPSPSAVQSYPAPDPNESPEVAAIRQGWEDFETVVDRYAKDPTLMDFSDVALVATGPFTLELFDEFNSDREEGIVSEGDVIHRGLEISPPRKDAEGALSSALTVCKDFTKHRTISVKTGEEIDPGQGREYVDTMLTTYTMQQLPNGKWVVASFQGEPKEC